MNETVVFETSEGVIEVELDRQKAPTTVENFVGYVNNGFYDGTIFHRVIKGFMIQGGGFLSDGREKPTMPPIRLESSNGLRNLIGTIAMARTDDPDSATSQFFINTANNGFLDHNANNDGYAVFGKVTKGLDVVKKIESVQTASKGSYDNWPVKAVVIKKAYIKT
ncbi:peptidylprolyl isomerase [Candidatus Woesearchaeota archaeon]|nr:peptidylprolyl isomerase [Candidatus Woesearchaeota archaeon]